MSETLAQPAADGLVRRLAARMWQFLFDIGQPKWKYVAKAVALTWCVGIALSGVIALIFPGPSQDELMADGVSIVLVVVVAPWIETWIMVPVLWMLQKFTTSRIRLCVISGLIFGVLHLPSTSWGLFGAWAFFVLTACFLAWRQISRERAIVMTGLVHMGINGLSTVVFLLGTWIGGE